MKLVKKVRVGSKLRRVYDAPKTPFERVVASKQGDAKQLSILKELHRSLDPFQLAKIIDRKLERIYELANRRLSPKTPEQSKIRQAKGGRRKGCGKDAPWKSPKAGFSTPLGNLAQTARFPLSHSPNNKRSPVTFQMARHG